VDKDKRRSSEVYRGKSWIVNLCKSLSTCIPSQVKRKLKGKVTEDVKLVLERYQISEGELYGGSLALGLVLSVIAFLCILIIGGDYILAMTVLAVTFMISSNLPIIIFLREARQLRTAYLSYADIILEIFLFSKIATGDVYDALVSVANLEEDAVSPYFKGILKKVLLEGENTEKAVINFVHGSPFEALEKHVSVIFKSSSLHEGWRQAIREARKEIREDYQRYTLELESRIVMIVGVSMFLPLLITVWLIAPNSEGLLYMILPLQSGSAAILSRLLLNSRQNIF